MKAMITAIRLAGAAFALLVACSSTSSKGRPGDSSDASVVFTAAACKAGTCGAEAKICGWGSSDAMYLGCLSDCDSLGIIYAVCPKQAAALYTCANLGSKVDCTTGKGTGCNAEEQQVATCVQVDGGG